MIFNLSFQMFTHLNMYLGHSFVGFRRERVSVRAVHKRRHVQESDWRVRVRGLLRRLDGTAL